MQDLKIALIGATGKAGIYILKALLAQNIRVKALIRNPEKLQIHHASLEIVIGDVKDAETVHALIEGCNIVISALGMGQPASEKTIFTQSTVNILKAMKALGLKRYIVITGINVDSPADEKDAKTQFATKWMYDNYPVSTADRQKEYEFLTASNLDWTLIRLPLIIQTDELTHISTSLTNCDGDQINASNLARFIIDQLGKATFINQAPFIWNS
ncbi:NAD-dependent epimerase/dehydratase family protein [Pedobacter sp. KBS0701]|uniref:NAD(P)-dependent oxidoreductase n=1 Tax=Pedobacter sp. KBS0701 TaxID=2578106 RepID=UPI00110D9A18|nr:NAD(P)H-binding protein [Pedobacter sp. KBS0701]QDW25664.1 NAD-dependent epimerase/dehydratase family protein [Pedobacter sp. KBS0701]